MINETVQAAPVIVEMAVPTADLAAQTAAYAAADASMFAATQAAAASTVQSAKDLVSSGQEAAVLTVEAAGATAAGVMAGFTLGTALLTVGGVAVVGGAGWYAWKNRNVIGAGLGAMRDRAMTIPDRLRRQTELGTYPEWTGHNDEAIWNDDELLEAATRP
jgi:hypothetical protein